MDNKSLVYLREGGEEQLELHPGFRFHPTDQELITYYLLPKTLDARFVAIAIGEADLRRVEPWELPRKAKMGEEEWYFFSLKERRYPTGLRTHRATDSGYWKATGKDKEIYGGKGDGKSKSLVGMRKTLVFYQGRAPKGVKSNWVMHEFRLEGDYSIDNLPRSAQNGWVISRVFNKDSSGKKTHISALVGSNAQGDEQIDRRPPQMPQEEPPMPPLTDSSPYNHSSCDIKPAIPKSSHLGDDLAGSDDRPWPFAPEEYSTFPYYSDHLQFSDCSFFDHEQSILKLLLDGDGNYSFEKDTGPSRGGGDDGGGGEIGNDFLSDECINSFFDY